ncbi:MAG TPA: YegS/Rv2252/BmrU family lipid kinase [Longimicrobiaceae bacterium]|nr:YegS/Rv2252/BmrU family lipid kinase [Longimicrobiaceae bacterium]
MRIALIVNTSSADAVEVLRASVQKLREAGSQVQPRLTFEGGDARAFAREAAAAGVDLVVAGGGDGTVNEVVNGIYDWLEERAEPASAPVPRLGIIPMGTANDLAGGLGIPGGDPETAFAIAVAGIPYAVDVGRVNGRCFLNVSTGGFGAEATDGASKGLKHKLGPLAYLVTGVQKFVNLETAEARFTSGGEVMFDGEFMIFAVGNFRRTGGGNFVTAKADLDDRLLDLCVVEGMSHVDFLKIAPQLRAGRHVDHERVTYRKVRELVVESPRELTVNADGEPLAARRFEYSIAPYRLTLVVPKLPE